MDPDDESLSLLISITSPFSATARPERAASHARPGHGEYASSKMPQAGVEPAPARFLRPPPLPIGLLRPLPHALSRTRTCIYVTLDHAPLPVWATRASTHLAQTCDSMESEGIEPSSPGCRPGVLPVGRRPRKQAIRCRWALARHPRPRLFSF